MRCEGTRLAFQMKGCFVDAVYSEKKCVCFIFILKCKLKTKPPLVEFVCFCIGSRRTELSEERQEILNMDVLEKKVVF